jgi:hypothetical protein
MVIREIAIHSAHRQRLVSCIAISIVIHIIHFGICCCCFCEINEASRTRDKDTGFVGVVGGLGGDDYVGAFCDVGLCCLFEVVGESVDNFCRATVEEKSQWCFFLVQGV